MSSDLIWSEINSFSFKPMSMSNPCWVWRRWAEGSCMPAFGGVCLWVTLLVINTPLWGEHLYHKMSFAEDDWCDLRMAVSPFVHTFQWKEEDSPKLLNILKRWNQGIKQLRKVKNRLSEKVVLKKINESADPVSPGSFSDGIGTLFALFSHLSSQTDKMYTQTPSILVQKYTSISKINSPETRRTSCWWKSGAWFLSFQSEPLQWFYRCVFNFLAALLRQLLTGVQPHSHSSNTATAAHVYE